MVRHSSNSETRATRTRVRDITVSFSSSSFSCRGPSSRISSQDIMRPTTGVIEFSPADTNHVHRASILHPLNTSLSPLSFASSPSPMSTFPITPSSAEGDEAWNLVPYHISWGHEYQEYRAGRLPGPEGDCIFLRSPTPLKNQRTTEACKKCRERKAKVSRLHLSPRTAYA
jgi:hypothetical protein